MTKTKLLLVHFEQDARHQDFRTPFVLALGPDEKVWIATTDKNEWASVHVQDLEFTRAQKLKYDATLVQYLKPIPLEQCKAGQIFHAGATGTGTCMGLHEIHIEETPGVSA